MKKIIIIAIAAVLLAGCDETESKGAAPKSTCLESVATGDSSIVHYEVVKINGHEYVSASRIKAISLLHAASCPCMNSGK